MTKEISNEHWLETYRSLITISMEGFKYLALVNGGAVVALLAYLGNVAGGKGSVPNLSCAMFWFLVGLVACGGGLLLSYITQLCLLNERPNQIASLKSHRLPLYLAIILFVVSLIAFCLGSWSALRSLSPATSAAQQSAPADSPAAARPSGS